MSNMFLYLGRLSQISRHRNFLGYRRWLRVSYPRRKYATNIINITSCPLDPATSVTLHLYIVVVHSLEMPEGCVNPFSTRHHCKTNIA